MDSVTQILLGASIGELVAGRKAGYKAAIWGGVAGTIPDLDVVFSLFLDPVSYLSVHRGFSHSLFFAFLVAPFLAWAVHRFHHTEKANYKDWYWVFFLGLFTHPLLDLFTGYGTQLLYPFSNYGFELNTIFIIDPLYTIPLFICLFAALRLPREHRRRMKWASAGLIISTTYLLLTVLLKLIAIDYFRSELRSQNIEYHRMMTIPGPFSSFLWRALVETDDGFHQAYYSIFDRDNKPANFEFVPNNAHKISHIKDTRAVKQLLWFSKGFYHVTTHDNYLHFNDLRFGSVFGYRGDYESYVFTFQIETDEDGDVTFRQVHIPLEFKTQDFRDLLANIWQKALTFSQNK